MIKKLAFFSSLVIAILAFAWFIYEPGFEPIIILIGSIVAAFTSKAKQESNGNKINEQEIKRKKDIDSINLLMKSIDIKRLNRNIEQHSNRAIHFNDIMHLSFIESGLKEFSDSSPVIYNEDVDHKIIHFIKAFHVFVSYASDNFAQSGYTEIYNFLNPSSFPAYEKWQKSYSLFQKKTNTLQESLNELIEHLRKNYLEVDLEALSEKAEQDFESYLSYVRS